MDPNPGYVPAAPLEDNVQLPVIPYTATLDNNQALEMLKLILLPKKIPYQKLFIVVIFFSFLYVNNTFEQFVVALFRVPVSYLSIDYILPGYFTK